MHTFLSKHVIVTLALAALTALVLLFTSASNVSARTLTVGCSVSDLKDAIETANGDTTPDVLDLASDCTYSLTDIDNSSPGPNGLPVISTDMTINGNNAMLKRESGVPFRVLQVEADVTLNMNHLTILGGYGGNGGAILNRGALTLDHATLIANGCASPGMGGAIYNDNGSVTISDSNLSGNVVHVANNRESGGGAIWSNGTLNITNTLFDGNTIVDATMGPGNGGGAIYLAGGTGVINGSTFSNNSTADEGGAIKNVGDLQIADSHFTGNTAERGGGILNFGTLAVSSSEFAQNGAALFGGGIHNLSTHKLHVADSSFHDNASMSGAGIENDGTAVIRHSSFANNHASGSGGGIQNLGILRVKLSTFTLNRADQSGGGIISIGLEAKDRLTINRSTFENNDAYSGGGIYNVGSKFELNNSTLANNHALGDSGYGGAIYMTRGHIGNSSLVENSAKRGGAIWNGGSTVLLNVTLYKNQAKTGASVFSDQQSILLRNTILANGSRDNCAVRLGSIMDGGRNLDSDATCGVGPAVQALLDKNGLADNGGPTRTIALRANSPAVDAGDDQVCAPAPIKSHDQRGVPRPQGAHCDIGAYELVR